MFFGFCTISGAAVSWPPITWPASCWSTSAHRPTRVARNLTSFSRLFSNSSTLKPEVSALVVLMFESCRLSWYSCNSLLESKCLAASSVECAHDNNNNNAQNKQWPACTPSTLTLLQVLVDDCDNRGLAHRVGGDACVFTIVLYVKVYNCERIYSGR